MAGRIQGITVEIGGDTTRCPYRAWPLAYSVVNL